MILKSIFLLSPLIICLISCSTTTQKNNPVNAETLVIKQAIESFPKVDIEIMLNDTALNFGDNILLKISVTKNGKEVQKVLFDKPSVSTGGPWATIGKVTDQKTKQSVLKYENKAMLSSQTYSEDQLRGKYYMLKPGQTISKQYELRDIVVFDYPANFLPKGTYEVQLFYNINPSNIITITIK